MKYHKSTLLLIFLIYSLTSCDSSKTIEVGLDEYLPGKSWQTHRTSTIVNDSTTTKTSMVTLTFVDECSLEFDEGSSRVKYFYYLSETQDEIDIFETGFFESDDKNGFSIFTHDNFKIDSKTSNYMLWIGQDTITNNTTGIVSYIHKTWI